MFQFPVAVGFGTNSRMHRRQILLGTIQNETTVSRSIFWSTGGSFFYLFHILTVVGLILIAIGGSTNAQLCFSLRALAHLSCVGTLTSHHAYKCRCLISCFIEKHPPLLSSVIDIVYINSRLALFYDSLEGFLWTGHKAAVAIPEFNALCQRVASVQSHSSPFVLPLMSLWKRLH